MPRLALGLVLKRIHTRLSSFFTPYYLFTLISSLPFLPFTPLPFYPFTLLPFYLFTSLPLYPLTPLPLTH